MIFWHSERKTEREREARRDREILDLRNALGDLEKRVRDVEMEWEDWFEKFRNLYARITRRQQREAAEPKENGLEPQPSMNPLAAELLSRGRTR